MAGRKAGQTEVVREKPGFSGRFWQLDLSDFSSQSHPAGTGRDSGVPGRLLAGPPGAPCPIPCPPGPLGLLGKRAAAGWLPWPGFSPPGALREELRAGSAKGLGILLNFYVVVSSLTRRDIRLLCPSGKAPREPQQL